MTASSQTIASFLIAPPHNWIHDSPRDGCGRRRLTARAIAFACLCRCVHKRFGGDIGMAPPSGGRAIVMPPRDSRERAARNNVAATAATAPLRDLPLPAGAPVGCPPRVGSACGLSRAGAAVPASCRGRRPADQATKLDVIIARLGSLAERARIERAEDRPAALVHHSHDHLRRARTIEDDAVTRAATVCDRDKVRILGQ